MKPRMTRWAAVAAYVVGCGLVMGAACPAPNSENLSGVHGDFQKAPNGLPIMKDAGFGWVRLKMNWPQIQADPPSDVACSNCVWGNAQTAIDAAFNAPIGMSIMVYFQGVPTWANGTRNPDGTGGNTNDPPTSPDFFKAFTKAFAKKFGDKVAAFELWNEPNLTWVGAPEGFRNKILIPGFQGIAEAKAELGLSPALVVAPATYSDKNSGAIDLAPYLEANNQPVVVPDVVSIHAYGQRGTQKNAQTNASNWVRNNFDHADLPQVWVTEGGFATNANAQDAQDADPGNALVEVQRHCENTSECFKHFVFNVRDVLAAEKFGLLQGTENAPHDVRNRLCKMERNWLLADPDPDVDQVAPCPCAPGPPPVGCSSQE